VEDGGQDRPRDEQNGQSESTDEWKQPASVDELSHFISA